MAKKITNLSDLGGMVFSTNPNMVFETEETMVETPNPEKQLLEIYLDKKQRAGKTVTLIKGFKGNPEDLKNLAKQLKNLCGVGGSCKDNEIIIQGNFRDKIIEYLNKQNYKTKRIGG